MSSCDGISRVLTIVWGHKFLLCLMPYHLMPYLLSLMPYLLCLISYHLCLLCLIIFSYALTKREGALDGLPYCKHLHQRLLPAIHHFSETAGYRELVVVSPYIIVHTLRKKGEIRFVLVLTILPSSLVPWGSLNWLHGWRRENIFGEVCWDGFTRK